ncbi:EAL domain-containing protein [Paeniroseomonas aquatica]|uniref:EAL domain-containing protein n=1 Tax=Paeniroseomonas aquatica TaxID=373043 RepID=A0ABT8ADZ3_9PROT|nr:EAL domain-containing protein [Paeniroseomonas aquatica]MDN3567880.1 EAL domain-containing protein [Paeniroseomonas aquatica]
MTDRERFLTFALAAAEMLLEASPDGRIAFAAGAFQSRLGQPPEAWIGHHVRELVTLPDRASFDLGFHTLLARDRLAPTGYRLANAQATPVSIGGLRLVGPDADRLCLTIAVTPGHGVRPNLADGPALREAAEAEARADQPRGTLGLLEIQAAGPMPAAEIDAVLRGSLADCLGSDSLAGELGGGRFGVVCASAADVGALGEQVARILADGGHAAAVATRALPLDDSGLTPMQATRALRYALAAFAKGGMAKVAAAGFDDGLSGFVAAACARGNWLRRAIADRRFSLSFQPIVALQSGDTHHYEALLRPEAEPDAPVQDPQDFVTFAETIGLSEELDWAVLGAVCGAARTARGTRIAANLSGFSLQSPGFRDRLLALLDAEPLLAQRLLLEITETAEIDDEAEAMRTVAALRERGVPLCIDDFGAGAAAFRYLRILRVDYVKIDGLYVTNAMRSSQDRTIVAAMVDLARGLGARVVAEHIETPEEAALMRDLGVDYGQGWLFGRPAPLPPQR